MSNRTKQNLKTLLRALIKHHKEVASAKEIRQMSGLSKKQVLRVVNPLINHGLLKRVGKGVYQWNRLALQDYYFKFFEENVKPTVEDILRYAKSMFCPVLHFQEKVENQLTGIQLHFLDLDEYGLADWKKREDLLYEVERCMQSVRELYKEEGKVNFRKVFGYIYWIEPIPSKR